MGYFPVRYDSRVVIYEPKIFIRLATGHLSIVHQMMNKFGSLYCLALINNDGRTTLELAAENGRQEVVHELLRVLRRKHLR